MSLEDDGLEFGEMDGEEVTFVLDSMSKSFRSSPWAGVVGNHLWHPLMKATLTGLLERGARVRVARASGKIQGYVMFETKGPDVFVHWVYTRDSARRLGVGSRLLQEAGVKKGQRWFYTFRTKSAAYLTRGHIAAHVPEAARRRDL